MVSIGNDDEAGEPVADRILDAAASCVLAFGVDRVTLAEIARRAGVSRPTVYRRFPDTPTILAALLTARIVGVLDTIESRGTGRATLVDRIVTAAGRLRQDEVIMAVLHTAPELAMVYIAERLGTSQQILIDALAGQLKLAQDVSVDDRVRTGDPRKLATMCLLITQSAIQSAQMVESILDSETLATELAHALNGYLAP